MPRADEVDLRVRAYGQRGLEFALRRADYQQGRAWAARCGILALLLAASGVLLAWERRPSRSAHALLLLGLALVALATWVYQASGAVVVEEAMLVVPALGVKLSKRRRNGATSSEFVDLSTICAVAVNEAITFSNVVYSLVFMVQGQKEMLLPFETFRPRIAVLQEIYRETKTLLFPDEDGGRKMHLPEEIAPASS